MIPDLLRGLAAFYILAAAFSGLSLLLSIIGSFPRATYNLLMPLINIISALIAALMLLSGNIMIAAGAKLAADRINELGQHIGLSASTGQKFVIITWTAFAL